LRSPARRHHPPRLAIVRVRAAAPLPQRDHEQQGAECELQDIHPAGRLAVVVRRARDEQDDRADQRESYQPSHDERRARAPAASPAEGSPR
jgi:hypothetical protein